MEHKIQWSEITWNIINSLLLGLAVFFGAFIDGEISSKEIIASVGASGIVCISKYLEYWKEEKGEYSQRVKLFNFV